MADSRRSSMQSGEFTKELRQSQMSLASLNSERSGPVGSPMPQFLKERLKVNFVQPLDKKYECPLCEEVLRYPVVFEECGHRCCSHCFETEIKRSDDRRCPVDQNKIDVDEATIDQDFNREVLALDVSCSNKESGCKWQGEYKDIQEHLENCGHADILCTEDCGAKFQRRFLDKHLKNDCKNASVTCSCREKYVRKYKKEHLDVCPKAHVPCPNKCDKSGIPRDELDKHIEEICPRTKINCEYDHLGCEHKSSREKLPKHYKGDIINHVKLVYESVMRTKALLDEHDATMVEHMRLFKESEIRVGVLERIAHNSVIWRVDQYSRKKKESKSGATPVLASPAFTTSKHGYRMCALLYLDGEQSGKGTHISAYVIILKGAHDALLKWPFTYSVTFYLLDQNPDPKQRKHKKTTVIPHICKENEPFLGRPRLEKNAKFGEAKFVAQQDLERRSYVMDDTLYIKVVVQCDEASEP